jgi:hypothetical protein
MSYEAKVNGGCREASSASWNEKTRPNATAEEGDEVTPGIVDRKVSLLVAAASAMATGCEPSMDQIIPNLIEAGVADADIRRAVEIGQRVKDAAADYMKEVADVLAGTQLVRNPGSELAMNNPTTEVSGCCG